MSSLYSYIYWEGEHLLIISNGYKKSQISFHLLILSQLTYVRSWLKIIVIHIIYTSSSARLSLFVTNREQIPRKMIIFHLTHVWYVYVQSIYFLLMWCDWWKSVPKDARDHVRAHSQKKKKILLYTCRKTVWSFLWYGDTS